MTGVTISSLSLKTILTPLKRSSSGKEISGSRVMGSVGKVDILGRVPDSMGVVTIESSIGLRKVEVGGSCFCTYSGMSVGIVVMFGEEFGC